MSRVIGLFNPDTIASSIDWSGPFETYEESKRRVACHPHAVARHPEFVTDFLTACGDLTLMDASERRFLSGSHSARVTIPRSQPRNPGLFVLSPVTKTPQDMHESLMMLSALKNNIARPWEKERACFVLPFYDGRDDRPAKRGDAVGVEIDGYALLGYANTCGKFYTVNLDPHSFLNEEYWKSHKNEYLAVTTNMLMAQRLVQDRLIDENTVIASPDIGGAGRAYDLAQKAAREAGMQDDLPLTVLNKKRNTETVNISALQGVLREEDVRGKTVIIRDDIGDTMGSLIHAAQHLKDQGADRVVFAYSHAVHSEKDGKSAIQRLQEAYDAGLVDSVYLSDSLPIPDELRKLDFIKVISVAPLLADISNSLLKDGARETRRKFQDHLYHPGNPADDLKRINQEMKNTPGTILPRQRTIWSAIMQVASAKKLNI